MKLPNYAKFIICILIPQIAGGIGSYFTFPNIASWFASLAKPAFQPPNSIFAPVWIALYFFMGVALYTVMTAQSMEFLKRQAYMLFSVQLFLNVAWSVVFFGMHSLLGGLIAIVLLWFVLLLTMMSFSKVHKGAAAMLVPYLFWVTFASLLNFSVFMLN